MHVLHIMYINNIVTENVYEIVSVYWKHVLNILLIFFIDTDIFLWTVDELSSEWSTELRCKLLL